MEQGKLFYEKNKIGYKNWLGIDTEEYPRQVPEGIRTCLMNTNKNQKNGRKSKSMVRPKKNYNMN